VARLRDIGKDNLFGGKGKAGEREQNDKGEQPMDVEAIHEEIDAIEKELNELRAVYELFFMGVERVEPTIQRDALRARIRRLRAEKITNSSVKFKVQMLQARLISQQNYWGRVNREREAGTYFRDVQKARKHQKEAQRLEALKAKGKGGKAAPGKGPTSAPTGVAEGAPPEGEALSEAMLKSDGQHVSETAPFPPRSAPPRTGASVVGRPSAQSADDLTEPKLKQIYQAYVTAKKRCGERVDLRYEEMAATLKKQVPSLMKTTGAQSIEFKVVIKSGKAVLKAIPKKEGE
jgi:hypothetical protein